MKTMNKTNLLALVLVSAFTVASTAPVTARAAGEDKLTQCLEKAESAANSKQARSECLWQHYSYMASYGR